MQRSQLATLLLALTAPVLTLSAQAAPLLPVTRELLIEPETANLSRLIAFTVSRGGDIFISQPQDMWIRVFSPTGVASTLGRGGEGPGEFQEPGAMGWVGDTLWVADPRTSRISFFSPAKKFIRTVRLPVTLRSSSAGGTVDEHFVWFAPTAVYADGSAQLVIGFAMKTPMPEWAKDVDRRASLLVRATMAGVITSRVGVVPPSPCYRSLESGKTIYGYSVPFCAAPLSTNQDGLSDLVTVVTDTAGKRTTHYRVTKVDGDGKVVFAKSIPYVSVSVPAEIVDSALARREKMFAKDPAALALARKLVPASEYPPVSAVVSGRDGSVWVEERTAKKEHRWRVLDSKGSTVGSVILPTNVTLMAAQLGMLWGVVTDEEGQQGVVRYRVGK